MANLLLLGAGTLAVGGLGYLGYRWWEDQQRAMAEQFVASEREAIYDRPYVPAGYIPPLAGQASPSAGQAPGVPPYGGTADPLGILSTLGGLAGTVPSLIPPGLIPGFPLSTGQAPTVVPLGSGILVPVLPAEATVTLPPGGQILVAAYTKAPELQQDIALALALTELYRQQASTLPGFVAFVAVPDPQTLVPQLIVQPPAGSPPIGPAIPWLGGRVFLGTLRAQPGTASPTYPRIVSGLNQSLESTILAARRP